MTDILSLPKDIFAVLRHRRSSLRATAFTFEALRKLRAASAVDAEYYRSQFDHAGRVRDPVLHYVLFGADEGLDPAPGFSTRFYVNAHPDVKAAGLNPLAHYIKHGAAEKRRIEPSSRVHEAAPAVGHDQGGGSILAEANRLALASRGGAEETGIHPWPLRDNPAAGTAGFGLYDFRPDDEVVVEAEAGRAFTAAFRLDSEAPDWEGAVTALNALRSAAPGGDIDVSIVIPVYGQLAHTLGALHSLFSHVAKARFEILVGDDASPDDSGEWLARVTGITHIRHVRNGGFIENCNRTAEKAKGRYIVLLNNDTRVVEGWLDALLSTFLAFPGTGLVGSKLFYPDGSLQEAGGIVWRDGGGWNYGRNDDPNRPRYCFARPADYVSAASVVLPRSVWQDLGGFDPLYKPAYYEDTDLAFRVRARGLKVIIQPMSKVIHYEGVTSGTDVGSGVKAHQAINRLTFAKRWREALETHRGSGDRPSLESNRAVRKRVLFLDACNPALGEDAGSLATVNLIKAYQALGYQVSFAPEDNFLYQKTQVSFLQSMGVECFYAPYEVSVVGILQKYGHLYDVVQLVRPQVATRNLEAVKRLAPRARICFLNADLHFLRMQRQAELEGLATEPQAVADMRRTEIEIIENVDVAMVHSTYEKSLLGVIAPASRVVVTPLIETVVGATAAYTTRKDIMFLGGYNHPPNVDAAHWLADEIWPRLKDKLPGARLLLVGSSPPASLQALASDRIIVTGKVPVLEPWYAKTRVFVAPLRYGAGAKGKVLSALAHGVPIVATTIAGEGMGLDNGRTIFQADTAEAIAAEIVRIFRLNAGEWKTLSVAAQRHVERNNGLAALTSALQDALQ